MYFVFLGQTISLYFWVRVSHLEINLNFYLNLYFFFMLNSKKKTYLHFLISKWPPFFYFFEDFYEITFFFAITFLLYNSWTNLLNILLRYLSKLIKKQIIKNYFIAVVWHLVQSLKRNKPKGHRRKYSKNHRIQ